MQRKNLGLVLIAGAAVVSLAGCYGSASSPEQGGYPGQFEAIIPSVEVIQTRLGTLPLEERLSGIVRAENQVTLYPEITAPIVKVEAQNGDYVRQGDPLVYLRDKQYQDQLNQADAALQISQADAKRTEATLNELKTRFARIKQLADRQMESPQQLESVQAQLAGADAANDQALARIAQAEANLEEQREMVRRTVVRAPISGYVGQRNAEVGMRVDQGTPLYVIGDFSRVRIDIAIRDRLINHIDEGAPVTITLENSESDPIEAEISRISPFLETGSYSATAEIDLDNAGGTLRPGMFVTVDVNYGRSLQSLLVPESALYENPNTGIMGVYVAPSLQSETPIQEPDVYDESNPPPLTAPTPMVFTPVEIVARGRGVAGISGINLGDWVITVGQNLIRPVNGQAQAKARPTSWDRIASLQRLQDQDLLKQFMEKQQRMAKEAMSSDSVSNGPTASAVDGPSAATQ